MSFLLLAEKYDLDVFAKEIVPYVRGGVLMPIVAVDGWFKIATQHEQHDGHEYSESDAKYGGQKQGISGQDVPEWIECTIHRKDWSHPITVREYMDEAFQAKSTTWRSYPRRMLRHRAFVQCARQVYGIGGIYEQSEAESIAEHHSGHQSVAVTPAAINYQPKHKEIVIDDDAVAKAEEFANGAEAQAKAKAEAQAKAKAEAQAKAKAEAQAKAEAEAQAKAEAEAQAKAKAEAQAKAEAEAQAKAEAEAQAKAEAEVQAKAEAEAQAKAEAEVQAKAEAEVQAKAEAEAQAKAEDDYRIIEEDEVSEEIRTYAKKLVAVVINRGVPTEKVEKMIMSQGKGTPIENLYLIQQVRSAGDEVAIAAAELAMNP